MHGTSRVELEQRPDLILETKDLKMVIGEKSHNGMGNAGKDAVGVTMVLMMLLQSNTPPRQRWCRERT
jgi:hypothetical protein